MSVNRILIVDDSRAARDMLRKTIMRIDPDLKIVEAVDGAEAIDRYKLSAYDLVFMDITMPEIDGLTALRRIRAIDAAARVVMVTAHRSASKVAEAREGGACGYIGKPFAQEHVARVIEAASGEKGDVKLSKEDDSVSAEGADVAVLVVDDSRTHRSIVKKYIDQLNLMVYIEEAENGEEAVKKYKEGRYDLVFLDVNMPKLGGVRALEEIRIHDPHAAVYMISANPGDEIAAECRALGAREFIAKPFGRDQVEEAINASITLL